MNRWSRHWRRLFETHQLAFLFCTHLISARMSPYSGALERLVHFKSLSVLVLDFDGYRQSRNTESLDASATPSTDNLSGPTAFAAQVSLQ